MTFRRLLAAAAATALAACGSSAQTPPAPAQDADPALWVVKDEDTTIYMLGTVHVLKPGLTWFDEAVKTAFDASDEVVIEVVAPTPEQAQAIVMRQGIDADGPPLSEKLPTADRPKYAAVLKSLGVPQGDFDRFQPWYASTLLVMLPLGKLGYDPASGAEHEITQAAKAANKPINGLEGFEEQLGYFAALPEGDQVAMVKAAIDDFDKIAPMVEQMVADWSNGRPESLATLLNEQLDAQPAVRKALLTDRNRRWADWIDKRMDKPGTVFMAVGAGHLAGHDSVQEMLKTHRIEAQRIKY